MRGHVSLRDSVSHLFEKQLHELQGLMRHSVLVLCTARVSLLSERESERERVRESERE